MDILNNIYCSSLEHKIYGMGETTVEEVLDYTLYQIEDILCKNDLDNIDIIELSVCGSRINTNPHKNADLDIVLYYNGQISENKLYKIFHKEEYIKQLTYDKVYIDIKTEKVK